MQRLAGLMSDVAERELASWPRGEPVATHPRLQALTLEVILRTVFGLDPGSRLDRLRGLLTEILDFGARPFATFAQLQRPFGGRGPWVRFVSLRDRADQLLFELIDERRSQDGGRDDVLAMLLSARHSDGSVMSDQELRDELMTLLVAGHETTASALAWAFERLARTPRVLWRLGDAVGGDDGDAYLTATVQETLRRRPVLPNAEPRLVKEPIDVGGESYPPGVCLIASAYLVHHDADVYEEPYAFRPERFLSEPPGTYTWIPFGGGRRRCIGASFAMLEMKIVLRSALTAYRLRPAGDGLELTRRRSITFSPGMGGRAVLEDRPPAATPA
jgi:cytochrome P450